MALIKKPWQCSVLSRTLRVAAPSLPPPPTLEGKGGILAIFQLVCHALVSITFAFSSYNQRRRVIAAHIGTQIGRIGKTETASDIKSENPLIFFAKTENQMLKAENQQTTMNTKTEKPKFFGTKTEKPI